MLHLLIIKYQLLNSVEGITITSLDCSFHVTNQYFVMHVSCRMELNDDQVNYITELLQDPKDENKSLILDFIQEVIQDMKSPVSPKVKLLLNEAAVEVASSELVNILKKNLLDTNLYLLVANHLIDVEDVIADLLNENILVSQLPAGAYNKLKRVLDPQQAAKGTSESGQKAHQLPQEKKEDAHQSNPSNSLETGFQEGRESRQCNKKNPRLAEELKEFCVNIGYNRVDK